MLIDVMKCSLAHNLVKKEREKRKLENVVWSKMKW